MNKERISRLVRIASNLGVILGLILLLVEIRESNRQAALASVQETMLAQNEANQIFAESEILPALFLKLGSEGIEGLSLEERVRVNAWERARLSRFRLQYYQYQDGYLEQSIYDDMMASAAARASLWSELELDFGLFEFEEP